MRRVTRPLLIALLAFVVLWIGGSFLAERLALHPRRWSIGPTPAAQGWVYQDVSFRSSDGITLKGWWIPGTNHETIVMVHGWTSSRQEPYDKSAYLHAAGYNLLVFDLRGHGLSGGTFTTLGLKEPLDVEAAVSFAKSEDPGPVALFGYSMGAATAVETAARDPQVAVVIEDSGYGSLADVIAAGFQRNVHLPELPFGLPLVALGQQDVGFTVAAVKPVTDASTLTKPLLAIVGTADTTVPPQQGYNLFAAAKGVKQLLVVPGAGHTMAYYKDNSLYEQTVLTFLKASLR